MSWQGRALGLALLIAGVSAAGRASAMLSVAPTNPTTNSTIVVTVGNNFGQPCWSLDLMTCGEISPDTLAVVASATFCNGDPDCNCIDFPPISLRRSCSFGQLAAGTHVAKYTELHLGVNDQMKIYTQTLAFSVQDVGTPVARRSWGSLKCRYR
jgi:hypothetical protein